MDGHSRYTSYWHDEAGNLARLTHPDGAQFSYTHDTLGRMTMVLDRASLVSIDDYVIRYWYNAPGSRYAAVRGAGAGGFTTVYYRDALDRPHIIANDLPGTTDDAPIELAYNPANQITQRIVYNDAYAAPAAYDVSRPYSVNGLNQYLTAGPASFQYDANGNLISDGTTSYTYDIENRLVSSSAGANLLYDPLGRLVQTSGGAAGTTQFLYDGDKLIAEYNGAGTLTKRYVHGPGVDEPVAVYEGAALGVAGRRYTLPDERGSIAALIHASGAPSVVNRYDSWGIPGAGNGGRFGYTGQTWIPELGMWYYKARIYSPTLGRFLQTDPIAYDDQINLYAYVGNDPLNNADPDGRCSIGAVTAGGTAAAVDGPFPAGEVVGGAIIAGSCIYKAGKALRDLWNAWRAGSSLMNEDLSPGEQIERLQKGIKSHQERIREHQEKLKQYEEDPDSMDNQGRLRDAAKDGNIRAKIIEGRRRVLERTIERHRNEIVKKQRIIDSIKRVCGSDASLRNKCLGG